MSLRYLSMSQLSEVSGLDRRTVKDRLAELKPTRREGKAIIFDSHEALPILLGFKKAADKDINAQILETQLLYDKARTEKIQIEVDVTKGLYVPIEDVCKAVEKEYTYARATLLSIPAKRAKVLALESDPATIRQLLDEDVNEALSHLQADLKYSSIAEENPESTPQVET